MKKNNELFEELYNKLNNTTNSEDLKKLKSETMDEIIKFEHMLDKKIKHMELLESKD